MLCILFKDKDKYFYHEFIAWDYILSKEVMFVSFVLNLNYHNFHQHSSVTFSPIRNRCKSYHAALAPLAPWDMNFGCPPTRLIDQFQEPLESSWSPGQLLTATATKRERTAAQRNHSCEE